MLWYYTFVKYGCYIISKIRYLYISYYWNNKLNTSEEYDNISSNVKKNKTSDK